MPCFNFCTWYVYLDCCDIQLYLNTCLSTFCICNKMNLFFVCALYRHWVYFCGTSTVWTKLLLTLQTTLLILMFGRLKTKFCLNRHFMCMGRISNEFDQWYFVHDIIYSSLMMNKPAKLLLL